MGYYDFTEMPVWQLGMTIVKEVYQLTSNLPRCEDYALRGQTREAALSITANIAEGFGRLHAKDKINFYVFSRGSCFEVRNHLIAGVQVNYYAESEIQVLNKKCLQVTEDLNKIIKGLSNNLSKP